MVLLEFSGGGTVAIPVDARCGKAQMAVHGRCDAVFAAADLPADAAFHRNNEPIPLGYRCAQGGDSPFGQHRLRLGHGMFGPICASFLAEGTMAAVCRWICLVHFLGELPSARDEPLCADLGFQLEFGGVCFVVAASGSNSVSTCVVGAAHSTHQPHFLQHVPRPFGTGFRGISKMGLADDRKLGLVDLPRLR